MFAKIKNFIQKCSAKLNVLMMTASMAMMSPMTALASEKPGKGGLGEITVGEDGVVTVGGMSSSMQDTGTNIVSTMKQLLGWITAGGIVIVVICLVVAGVMYATSIGNPQKRHAANSAITGALMGAAVIGGASMLAGLAYGILG